MNGREVDESSPSKVRGVAALSILAKSSNSRSKELQLLVSLMLVARDSQKLVSLNRLGLCLSYTQTKEWIKRIPSYHGDCSRYSEGEWILVFDKVNFFKKTRHERTDRSSQSWDYTSRLAEIVFTHRPLVLGPTKCKSA